MSINVHLQDADMDMATAPTLGFWRFCTFCTFCTLFAGCKIGGLDLTGSTSYGLDRRRQPA